MYENESSSTPSLSLMNDFVACRVVKQFMNVGALYKALGR